MNKACQSLEILTTMQMHSCNFGRSNQCSMLVASIQVADSYFRASNCLILPHLPSAYWICDSHRRHPAIFLWGLQNANKKYSTNINHRTSSRRNKTHNNHILYFPWVVCGCVVFWETRAHVISPAMTNWGLLESSFHSQKNSCTLMNDKRRNAWDMDKQFSLAYDKVKIMADLVDILQVILSVP
jgi:hypothetical protein